MNAFRAVPLLINYAYVRHPQYVGFIMIMFGFADHLTGGIVTHDYARHGTITLTVINLHRKAPLAANIPGQKIEPFVWKSVGGCAEGYFLAAVQRAAQALELRLHLERLFEADKHKLIAVGGDLKAEDHEVPLRILIAAEENTGNPELSGRSLVALDRALPTIGAGASCIMVDRRCSTIFW